MTLIEITIVIAIIALIAGLTMPAIRSLMDSFTSVDNVKTMIGAAMASARAIAAKEQRYAGIRFQQDSTGNQYMIAIIYDHDMTRLENGFRAVDNVTPIKLPENIRVMDLRLGSNADRLIILDGDISAAWQVTDTTTFSIVFSPSGNMVKHLVRVRNKDGCGSGISYDTVFNKQAQVDAGIGKFYQDDYYVTPNYGLDQESSRNSFIIYEKDKFKKAYDNGTAYSGYLYSIVPNAVYVNPYTGTIVNK